jgi:hypothetical protein
MRAVGDDEQLDVLEQAGRRPERLPLVPVDLVERLLERHPAALELHVHQRQPVDQDRDVVPVGPLDAAPLALGLVLVDDLQAVVVNVCLVQQGDVLAAAVVPHEHQDVVLVDADALLNNALVLGRDLLLEQAGPLVVGEAD